MLYCNVNVKAEVKEFDFGKISQIVLGEKGRGRKLLALTCPDGVELKGNSLNKEFTIGLTKSGKPRIIKKEDDELYMLLSSKGGYTRRGNGLIRVLESQKSEFTVLARGNGADGDAGRIGFWDVVLLKAPKEGVVCVRTSGQGYETPADLYVIHEGNVFHCTLSTLEECCEAIGMELPFLPKIAEYDPMYPNKVGSLVYDLKEWTTDF